jgi:hypothetical protein
MSTTSIEPATAGGRSRLFALTIVAVIAIGTVWRLLGVTDWPIKFHETVQYESAITARSIWLRLVPRALTTEEETWARDGHWRVTSPPILQGLAAAGYVAAGSEEPWLTGVWNVAFWLLGGWFVYRTATTLANDRLAGLVGLTWFLLNPGGIVLSRSFQPESLLVLGTAVAAWALARPPTGSAMRDTLFCSVVCLAAAFVKPGVLFFPLFGGFAARVLTRPDKFRTAAVHWLVFVAAVALPGVVYTLLVFGPGVTGRFMPALLAEPNFYEQVALRISRMVGTTGVVLGVVGAVLCASRGRWVPVGLLLGYVAYIPTFTWHTPTHMYYHAHLIPLVAICLGVPVAGPLRRLRPRPVLGYVGGAVVIVFYLAKTYYIFTGPWQWLPGVAPAVAARQEDVRAEAELGREVGAIVGPGASCVCLAKDNALPLEYYAWVQTQFWPKPDEIVYILQSTRTATFDPVEYLNDLIRKHNPRYFVVTDLHAFDAQPYLIPLLKQGFPFLVASTERYRIYSR